MMRKDRGCKPIVGRVTFVVEADKLLLQVIHNDWRVGSNPVAGSPAERGNEELVKRMDIARMGIPKGKDAKKTYNSSEQSASAGA